MPETRLRNHIPLSGPATREPCTGDEPFLRVSLGFVPRWYHKRLGIDFSQQWHTDPVHRYDTLVAMKTFLHEIFPPLRISSHVLTVIISRKPAPPYPLCTASSSSRWSTYWKRSILRTRPGQPAGMSFPKSVYHNRSV